MEYAVAVTKCESYDAVQVHEAVERVVQRLGGMERFCRAGETILVKPNMLSPRTPENAVTTHPEVVRAVIRVAKNRGASVMVGDTPVGLATPAILKRLAAATGIGRVCEEEGVQFVFMIDTVKKGWRQGVAAKSFDLAAVLDQVDGVISVGKLKTHTFTGFTGAVKNNFGLIPGLRKVGYHLRMRNPETFSAMLVDLAECVKPRLTVIDAVTAMEGDGPSGGVVRELDMIAASDNVHALDRVLIDIIGADWREVPTARIAVERGLAPKDSEEMTVLRDEDGPMPARPFRMPGVQQIYGGIPAPLGKLAAELTSRKPVFLRKRCTKCWACVDVCPTHALARAEEVPRINRHDCIRCYCCHESCPSGAISLSRMPTRSMGRMVGSAFRKRRTQG